MVSLLRQFFNFRKSLIIVLTPLLLLPLPVVIGTTEARCAYAVLIMAIFWITEALPIAVTALLPVVLMPCLGVMASKPLCKNYLKDTVILFIGGLVLAVAVENVNLHKRIALRVLLFVGSQPKWLMFGFMLPTAILSMWISNTATTSMMIPIANAVMSELKGQRNKNDQKTEAVNGSVEINLKTTSKSQDPETETSLSLNENDFESGTLSRSKQDTKIENICKGLTLCIAYAANIGGTGTLIGTGANMVAKGQIDTLFGSDAGVNFSSWFIFAFPNMLLTLMVAWVWLQVMFLDWRSLFQFRCENKSYEAQAASRIIRAEYKALGRVNFAEASVLVHFVTLALLWITREPDFFPGWGDLFKHGYVSDATASIFVMVSLFIWPSERPNFLCLRAKGDNSDRKPKQPLVDWWTVAQKLPWSVIMVVGGGFAMADACKESGLSQWIGKQCAALGFIPSWATVLIVCIMLACFTEVTSNVSTATIFLPILAELAVGTGVNPLYLMIPATISTSFAFMLPVATPPNAIVFSYGQIKIGDMIRAGFVLNFMCIMVLNVAANTWGKAFFHFHTFPDWAKDVYLQQNITHLLGINITSSQSTMPVPHQLSNNTF